MRLSLSRNPFKGITAEWISKELYVKFHSKENGSFTVMMTRKEARKLQQVLQQTVSQLRA